MSITTRYQRLRAELDKECVQAGRKPEEVTLLAVSKTVDIDQVAEAYQAGSLAFGENRPDELLRKQKALPQAEWHFIGNIQSRRIPDIVSAATLIHSVCKEEHLKKINKAALQQGKVQRVLLEVNVSGEASKSGFAPDDVEGVVERALSLDHVTIEGLMTMAPQGDHEAIVATFSGLNQLKTKVERNLHKKDLPCHLSALSMGMTEDWRCAVGFGSTIVRLGRAVFSDAFEQA